MDNGGGSDGGDTERHAAMRRQLRQGDYADVVKRRCEWDGDLDALRSDETLFASGIYDHVSVGAWGLVVCLRDSVELFSGCVDADVGKNSPYRSEAYGLLAGLRYAWEAGIQGDIHVLDNSAVVTVFQDCESRGVCVTRSVTRVFAGCLGRDYLV